RHAEALFRWAISLRQNFIKAQFMLGRTLTAQGRLQEAQAEYDALLRLRPSDVEEWFKIAEMCGRDRLFVKASQFYAKGFAEIMEEELFLYFLPRKRYRQNAAACATLAAAGMGDDAANLDERQRLQLRQQAMGWLQCELDLVKKLLVGRKPAGSTVLYSSAG